MPLVWCTRHWGGAQEHASEPKHVPQEQGQGYTRAMPTLPPAHQTQGVPVGMLLGLLLPVSHDAVRLPRVRQHHARGTSASHMHVALHVPLEPCMSPCLLVRPRLPNSHAGGAPHRICRTTIVWGVPPTEPSTILIVCRSHRGCVPCLVSTLVWLCQHRQGWPNVPLVLVVPCPHYPDCP